MEVCPLVSQEPPHYVETVLVPAAGLAGAPVKPLKAHRQYSRVRGGRIYYLVPDMVEGVYLYELPSGEPCPVAVVTVVRAAQPGTGARVSCRVAEVNWGFGQTGWGIRESRKLNIFLIHPANIYGINSKHILHWFGLWLTLLFHSTSHARQYVENRAEAAVSFCQALIRHLSSPSTVSAAGAALE